MRQEFLKYMLAGTLSFIAEGQEDAEAALKELGYEMGKLLVAQKDFRQESRADLLLYRIVYNLLPSVYNTKRELSRSETDRDVYLIDEHSPLMNSCVSLPPGHASFSCDAIFAGVIEFVMRASGFRASVSAHNNESASKPDKVVYVVDVGSGRRPAEVVEL